MTIITAPRAKAKAARAGFSMVEMLVATTITGIVLTGVLTTFVFFSKTGVRMANYTDMETGARETLSRFSQDVREADTCTWLSATSLRLTVSGATVTYAYNSGAKTFTRTAGSSTEVLITNITSFQFTAYNIAMTTLNVSADLTAAGTATKMVQVDMDLARSATASGSSTSQVLSARYVLRNKKVT